MAFTPGFCVDGVIGVDFTKKGTSQLFRLGLEQKDSYGRVWMYVKAGGAIALGKWVKAVQADNPFNGVLVSTASAAATKVLGLAGQTLANGDYAWIVKSGPFEDDAVLGGALAAGSPAVSDANGASVIAAATDINNACGYCLVDDGDSTGTIYADC